MGLAINQSELNQLLSSFEISKWSYTEQIVPLSLSHFLLWKKQNKAGPLTYLTDHRGSMRKSLKEYFPKCKSALVFLFDYSCSRRELEKLYKSRESNGCRISSYTLGFEGYDYHLYLGETLKNIQLKLEQDYGIQSKITLDVHPVLERDLAYSSGLGWFGKNSMMINQELGSYTMIGSLLLNTKLNVTPSKPELDHCGNCTACIDLCPTLAIDEKSRTIDANKCISTYTIELFKEAKPPQGMEKFGGEIFGCDICQDVCPWNKKHLNLSLFNEKTESKKFWSNKKRAFLQTEFLQQPVSKLIRKIESMSNREYKRWVAQTPFERLGRVGILKNLKTFLKLGGDKFGN